MCRFLLPNYPMRKIYLITLLALAGVTAQAQSSWKKKTDFGGAGRLASVGFSIGTKGYIGTGTAGGDFWEYDPSTDAWTQKSDFGGGGRWGCSGFSIGAKGYIGLGYAGNGWNFFKDFWEYDPAGNTWVQKADFGGTARQNAACFVIGTKAYICAGQDASNYIKDFWEYNQGTDTWTQKANFGGSARRGPVGFAIGSKGYVVTGMDGFFPTDFWEYNPSGDSWTKKADFKGDGRWLAAGFSIGNKGYVGGGSGPDFWEYNQSTDTWTRRDDIGTDSPQQGPVGFSIGSKGYFGTGYSTIPGYSKAFWEYDTCKATITPSSSISFCQGSGITLTANSANTYLWSTGATTPSITVDTVKSYSVTITQTGACASSSPSSSSVLTTSFLSPGIDLTYGNTCLPASTPFTSVTTCINDTSWLWNFGDPASGTANIDSIKNPSHLFSSSGTYLVTLIINKKDTVAKSLTIAPHADFLFYAPCINQPTNIYYDWNSCYFPFSFVWNFGDPASGPANIDSSGYYVYHQYASTGTYTISLVYDYTVTLTHTVTVTIPPVVSLGNDTIISSCNSILLDAGNPASYFYWSNGATTQKISIKKAGTYYVDVYDSISWCWAGDTIVIGLDPAISVDSIHSVSGCGASDGEIFTSITGASGPYTYLWMPGGYTTQDISGIVPGSYTLTVTNAIACSNTAVQNIYAVPPPTSLSICIATVDSTKSTKNIIVWDKPVTTTIDSFRIYREISAVYTPIATVPYSSLSQFTDSTNGVDPKTSFYRYKISSIDTNGVESALSNPHQTIWLQVAQPLAPALDLAWTDYCGMSVVKYYIFRDSVHNSNWQLIDSVLWGTNTYIDSFPPNDTARYRVESVSPTPCIATIKKGPQINSTTVKTTKSNSSDRLTTPVSANNYEDQLQVSIYPNPNPGQFTIVSPVSIRNVEIYTVYGEKAHSETVNRRSCTLHCDLTNGIYFVKSITDKGAVVRKVVISR